MLNLKVETFVFFILSNSIPLKPVETYCIATHHTLEVICIWILCNICYSV
jgi:hypothetical protein